MQKSRQLSLKECYSILNLEKGATLEDVKRAYRRRAFELHPDLHPGNAEAGRQFQRLNEAYVALSQILQTEAAKDEATRTERAERDGKRRGASNTRSQSTADAGANSEKTQQEHNARAQESASAKAETKTGAQTDTGAYAESASSASSASGTSGTSGASGTTGTSDTSGTSGNADAADSADKSSDEERRKRAASAAYGREEVLRDLLNDPFARRVFEDIYSEVNRQTQETTPPPSPPRVEPPPPPPKAPPKPRNVQMEWGSHKLNLDFSKGLKGMVKGWLRHQIDDEQTIKMPASSLIPGARIRLQIRRGLSEELSTIEITLPKDFVVGKPVRLRGLGRKVGQWQGDLYLTLESR